METVPRNTFVIKATQLVIDHLGDARFSIHELAAGLFLGREQTHRKIKEYTGLSAGKFIRFIRLIQAIVLLKQDKPISQIAFEVGFEDPSYFTKCFKEVLHSLPQDVKHGNFNITNAPDLIRFYDIPEIRDTLQSRNIIIEIPHISRDKPNLIKKKDRTKLPITIILSTLGIFLLWSLVSKTPGRSELRLKEDARIAVIPFLNQTGNSQWDPVGDIASNWISAQLAEIKDIKMVPYFTIKQYQSYIGILPDDPENRPTFQEVVGAQYFVTGNYFLNSSQLYFDIQLIDAFTQETIYDLPTITGPTDSVMTLIDEVRSNITGLISSLESVRQGKFAPPKYQAYQNYLLGLNELRVGLFPSKALEYFKKANEIEPEFVMTQVFLTWFYKGEKRDSVLELIGANPNLTGYEKKVYLELFHTYNRTYREGLKVTLEAIGEYPGDYYFNMEAAHLALSLYMPELSLQILSQLYDPLDSEAGLLWHHFKIFNFTQSLMMLRKNEEALDYLRSIPSEFQSPAIPSLQLRLFALLNWSCTDVLRAIDTIAGSSKSQKVELLILGAIEYRLTGNRECSQELVKKALHLIEEDRSLTVGRYYEYDKMDALFISEQYEVLKVYLQQQLSQHPDSTDLIIYLAQTEAAMGNLTQALQVFSSLEDQEVIYWRRNPYEYQQDYLRAKLYALAGKLPEANDFLMKAKQKGQLRHHIDFENDFCLMNLFDDPAFQELVQIREDPSLMDTYRSILNRQKLGNR